jgi:multicomponent Na+:H+ antiporter subunit B
MRRSFTLINEKAAVVLCGLGVLIYAVTGALCILFGSNYLDYGSLSGLFGIDPVAARSLGILFVEIGVGITVMAVIITLYYNLASAGRHDEGL